MWVPPSHHLLLQATLKSSKTAIKTGSYLFLLPQSTPTSHIGIQSKNTVTLAVTPLTYKLLLQMTYYQELQSVYLAPSRENISNLIYLFNLPSYKVSFLHLSITSHRYRLNTPHLDSLMNGHAFSIYIVKFCKRIIHASTTKNAHKSQRILKLKKMVKISITR